MYVYRISSLGASSKTYGKCEICGEYVSDVHLQVESVEKPDDVGYQLIRTGDAFGHEECLRGIRKQPSKEHTAEQYQDYRKARSAAVRKAVANRPRTLIGGTPI